MDLRFLELIETHIFNYHMVEFAMVKVVADINFSVGALREALVNGIRILLVLPLHLAILALDKVFIFYITCLVHIRNVDMIHCYPLWV